MNNLYNHYSCIINKFPAIKVGVVGDIIADVFMYGKPYHLSREAPVVVIKHESQKVIPGGAANTVNNLIKLGAKVYPIGLIGDDAQGHALLEYFSKEGTEVSGILRVPGRNTITKMRIMAGSTHTSKQQVLRVDYDPSKSIDSKTELKILDYLDSIIEKLDGVIVSDYNYDVFSQRIIDKILEISKRKLVVVDSHDKLPLFNGVSIITPNEEEAYKTSSFNHLDKTDDILKVGEKLMDIVQPKIGVLVTRGNEGMMVFEKGEIPLHIPISGSDDVTDVTGAGDTVVSLLTLSLLAGANFADAARIANYAAGIVVMKSGTATTNPDELKDFIKRCLNEKITDVEFA